VNARVKILFLDIDGVLNSHDFLYRPGAAPFTTTRSDEKLDRAAVLRLNRLIAETGALVVVSSTWRHGCSRVELQEVLDRAGFMGVVRDKTPEWVEGATERGHEIQAWLDEWNAAVEVVSFVILDDDSDMAHLQHRLVQTKVQSGLLDHHVDRAITMLNGTELA
jgi:hypothetical protein